MVGRDIKEKLIILGVMTGVFLPVRLAFTSLVSDQWIGSFGVVSVLALVFIVLVKRNKLGKFGKIFENQMRKTIGGRAGKYVIFMSMVFLFYFGSSLFFIERGNTIYFDDKEIFLIALKEKGNLDIEDFVIGELGGPQQTSNIIFEDFVVLSNLEYSFSIAFAIMDDLSEGWLSHLFVVVFVEQIEVMGLICFYRKTSKPIIMIKPPKEDLFVR